MGFPFVYQHMLSYIYLLIGHTVLYTDFRQTRGCFDSPSFDLIVSQYRVSIRLDQWSSVPMSIAEAVSS